MKGESMKRELLIVTLLLIGCGVIWMATEGDTIVDLQFHDSYFVIDKTFLIGLVVGPFGFLIFLTRAIRRWFKNVSTNICLAVELVIMALITYYIIRVQQDYVRELQTLEGIDASTMDRMLGSARDGILWSWVIFGVWCIALLLIIFRTMRIWRGDYQRT